MIAPTTFFSDTASTLAMDSDNMSERDLLIAVALTGFSVEFETASPKLSSRAWQIAVEYAGKHDLRPGEAIKQLNWDTEG